MDRHIPTNTKTCRRRPSNPLYDDECQATTRSTERADLRRDCLLFVGGMEQNSTDVIIKTENLINAVQNEPGIWNSELNSSEEEKE